MLCAKCQSLWKCSQINCQISVALPHMRVCVCVYACANASVCAVCVVCAQHSTAIQLKSNMQQQSSYPTRRLPRPLASLTPHAPRGNCYKCCLACYVGVCKYVTIITLLAGGVGRGEWPQQCANKHCCNCWKCVKMTGNPSVSKHWEKEPENFLGSEAQIVCRI